MRTPRSAIIGPDSFFHKIWRAHNREFLMQKHQEKQHYLGAIREDYLARCTDPPTEAPNPSHKSSPDPSPVVRLAPPDRFSLFGYCIMSNHVHETGKIGAKLKPFSEHMRRAHGRFGLGFNKRHHRLGKVAHDRPKTLSIEDDQKLMQVMFYGDCNPVRAGLIKHPMDLLWRGLSSCRFYALGEESEFSDMLTLPDWYLRLGKTPLERQARYRSLLDQYLVEIGIKRDPKMSRGYYCGNARWVEEKRKQLGAYLKSLGQDPPPS